MSSGARRGGFRDQEIDDKAAPGRRHRPQDRGSAPPPGLPRAHVVVAARWPKRWSGRNKPSSRPAAVSGRHALTADAPTPRHFLQPGALAEANLKPNCSALQVIMRVMTTSASAAERPATRLRPHLYADQVPRTGKPKRQGGATPRTETQRSWRGRKAGSVVRRRRCGGAGGRPYDAGAAGRSRPDQRPTVAESGAICLKSLAAATGAPADQPPGRGAGGKCGRAGLRPASAIGASRLAHLTSRKKLRRGGGR